MGESAKEHTCRWVDGRERKRERGGLHAKPNLLSCLVADYQVLIVAARAQSHNGHVMGRIRCY